MRRLKVKLKKRRKSFGQLRIKAQVTLELTISLIICLILLVGATKIFVWLNQIMVERQQAYQNIRTQPIPKVNFNFYNPPPLDIFGEKSENSN